MKTLKYVSLVVMITIFSVSVSQAQRGLDRNGPKGPPPPPDPEQVDQIIKDLTVELTLTGEQSEKFEKLFRDHMAQVIEMREEQQLKQREQMDTFRKSFEEDLSGILNEAQMEKFKSIHPGPGAKPDRAGRSGERGYRGKHQRPCRR